MGFSISQRLSHAESNLLHAASIGGPALAAFSDQLNNLLADIDHEIQSNNMDDRILSTWGAASWRVLQLSEQLLDVQTTAETMFSTLQTEMEAMFSSINIDHEDGPSSCDRQRSSKPQRSLSPSSNPRSRRAQDTCPSPPYIESAYFWLLNNLHNPYPSKEARASIVRTTGSDSKAVDAWFIDARKRIGWNALRKEHFSNKRVDIVDAAMRFFFRPDEKRPVDVNIELKLAAIEKRAKELYCDRFTESTLALKLDVAVKDLTPEIKAQAKEDEWRRRDRERRATHQSKQDALAAASYPSPAHSPGRTPEPLEIYPLLEDNVVYGGLMAGQKRRSPSVAFDENEDHTFFDKSNKRIRLDAPSPIHSTGLASPAPSSHESLQDISPVIPSPIQTYASVPSIYSRKRRLSEGDAQGAPKRPRNLPVGPRMHAVSDPSPMSSVLFEASTMDDWFQSNFGIPNSVQVDDLDQTFPLDVEVFDYSVLRFNIESSASTSTVAVQQPDDPFLLQSVEVDHPSLPAPADESVISTKDVDYGDLFCDYIPVGPSVPNNGIVDIPAMMFQAPLASLTPDAPTLMNQMINLDFLGQNLQDNLQNPGHTIPPSDSSPLFDTSLMGINPLDSSLDSILLQANKVAKQKILREMKEATRRLEEEIAASS